jgi:hypothetical protein
MPNFRLADEFPLGVALSKLGQPRRVSAWELVGSAIVRPLRALLDSLSTSGRFLSGRFGVGCESFAREVRLRTSLGFPTTDLG